MFKKKISKKTIIFVVGSLLLLLYFNYLKNINYFSKNHNNFEDNPSKAFIDLDTKFINSQKDVRVAKMKNFKLNEKYVLERFNLVEGFYSGIHNIFPGSGYIDFHGNNLIVLSSRGFLGYTKNIEEELKFTKIKNNLNDYINSVQFNKSYWFSIKDLYVFNNQIFVSFTQEIKENCWNTSVIYGDINYEIINFKKMFTPDICIHSSDNVDGEFNAHQSGGKIISFDENHIILSIGDYRQRHYSQNINSVNGKIIRINITTGEYEIISMGHRNPQGLYYNKDEKFIISTEHGPMGGDEINLIELEYNDQKKILNFGWPIVSAGEHYGGKIKTNETKYKKYPLYKSHSEYGFIEPLRSFVPSIAISEITKIGDNKYIFGSMKDKSIYIFELNKNKKINNLEKIILSERVRDLIFKNNKLYLFLEDTASIGVINFK